MKSYQKYARRTAALLLACGMLTAQAWAAQITPSTTAVTLGSGEQTFTVDVKLSEDNAFAGAEFGLDLPEGVTLTRVEFLDAAVQDANHSPEVTVEGRTYFGFYTAENTFSGEISVARLTFTYTGEADTAFSLGSSKVVTVQEDGSTKGDTSAAPFTVQITRKSSSSGSSGSSGGSSGGSSSGSGSSGSSSGSSAGTGTSSGSDASSNPFTDLDGHWGKDAILAAVNDGLFSGTSATTFSPNAAVTRGMVVTVLHRMEGTPAGGSQPFADVAADAYYADAVAWAAEKGIVAGTSATTFAPNASITREQMAAILYRYAGFKGLDVTGRADLTAFADAANISAYAKESMSWANAEGLISGRSAAELAPQGTATRAEMAQILMNYRRNVAE